jgi:hypothetical protein
MVIKNTEIAVRCGMMMHHIVMNCVNNNIAAPTFIAPKFVEEVLNYNEQPSNPLVIQAKMAFDPFFTPVYEDMDGRPWLLISCKNISRQHYLFDKGKVESIYQGYYQCLRKDSSSSL